MQISALKDSVQGAKRVPVSTKVLEVEFSDSSYNRLRAHYLSYQRTWASESLTPTFSEEEFMSYIETIFQLRCITMDESPKEYSKVVKRVKIPALIYLVLENLGRVEVRDLGLVLTPIWTGKKKRMTPSDVDLFSLKMQELEDLGHEMARGLPSTGEGGVDFMMMQVIDSVVRTSMPETHPVYALLRSFIKLASFQDLVIPRIHFLEEQEYDIQYNSLIRRRS